MFPSVVGSAFWLSGFHRLLGCWTGMAERVPDVRELTFLEKTSTLPDELERMGNGAVGAWIASTLRQLIRLPDEQGARRLGVPVELKREMEHGSLLLQSTPIRSFRARPAT